MTLAALVLWTSLAALASALGPFLLGRRRTVPARLLGWAGALAAGTMLGTAYLLMSIGVGLSAEGAALGAVIGIALTFGAHALYGVAADSPTVRTGGAVAAAAIHSAPEGVAIGVAMALDRRFGTFLLVTLAIHNIWEAAILASHLAPAGVRGARAAVLAVLTNSMQVLFAVAAFALVSYRTIALAPTLGLAFGALVYLCLAELLPLSYREAGRTSIAVVVSIAAGVVAYLGANPP